jgi:hypothetical protein
MSIVIMNVYGAAFSLSSTGGEGRGEEAIGAWNFFGIWIFGPGSS